MFNKVVLVGHLCRDIELQSNPDGSTRVKNAICVNRIFKNQQGNKVTEPMFIDCVFWRRNAEILNEFCRKGSKLLIDGRLAQETWADKEGKTQSKHVIQVESLELLDNRADNTGNATNQPTQQNDDQYPF